VKEEEAQIRNSSSLELKRLRPNPIPGFGEKKK